MATATAPQTAPQTSAAAAAPATPAPAAEAAPTTRPDIESEIIVGGIKMTLIETEEKKGRAKGETRYYLKIDLSKPDPFADVRKAVGEENWNKTIMAQVIRPACNDATHDFRREDGTEGSDSDWEKMFREQFLPNTRRSSTGVKQLREKQQALFGEINPLLMKQAHGEKLTPEDNNRLLQLLADFGDINAKIESKSRKGKKKEAAAA